MRTVDLAIVGAGPAGSAAAIRALALAPSARVALIDRARFPRDKTCGDALGPEAVAWLRRLDAGNVLDGYPSCRHVRVTAPSGAGAEGTTRRAGRVVPREVLDARLREIALARGAEPVTQRVSQATHEPHRVVLDDRLAARTVIAADGANSTLRRRLGLGGQPRHHTALAMRGYAPSDAAHAWLEIAFVAERWPAYAWSFDTGTGVRNVGYGPFDASRVGTRAQLRASLERLRPGDAVQEDSLRAHPLPLSTARPSPATGRVLLAGDAASLVNPLTGEGIAYALLSGALAGAAAVTSDDPGDDYRRALRRRLARHHRHTWLVARMLRSQTPIELAVAAAADDPDTFDGLAELALGPGLITPGAVVGLTRAALHRRIA